jgi:hypothetical protein
MEKWYTAHFTPDVAVTNLHGRDESTRIEKAKNDFLP